MWRRLWGYVRDVLALCGVRVVSHHPRASAQYLMPGMSAVQAEVMRCSLDESQASAISLRTVP